MTTDGGNIDDLKDAGDAALVFAIARWRQDALGEAYRRHGGAVFALAQRVLSDRARAEDVVQEVFLRLWNHPDRYDPDRGTLRSYLLTQTHGRSVDAFRSDRSRRDREARDARAQAHDGYDLEREVVDLSVADSVRAALAQLQDGERRAIELAYFGGRSYREVAEVLDEPEGTIKSRIRSGLRRMRTALVDSGAMSEATS